MNFKQISILLAAVFVLAKCQEEIYGSAVVIPGPKTRYVEIGKEFNLSCNYAASFQDLKVDNYTDYLKANKDLSVKFRFKDGQIFNFGSPYNYKPNRNPKKHIDSQVKDSYEPQQSQYSNETHVLGSYYVVIYNWTKYNEDKAPYECDLDFAPMYFDTYVQAKMYAIPQVAVVSSKEDGSSEFDLREELVVEEPEPSDSNANNETDSNNVGDYGNTGEDNYEEGMESDNNGENNNDDEDYYYGNSELDNTDNTISRRKRQIEKTNVATCNVNSIYPKPDQIMFTITRSDGEMEPPVEGQIESVVPNADETFNAVASLLLPLEPKYNGASVSCWVSVQVSEEDAMTVEATSPLSLSVLYDVANVKILVEEQHESPVNVALDQPFTINCSPDGNPQPSAVEILRRISADSEDGEVIANDRSIDYSIDKDEQFKCRAYTRNNKIKDSQWFSVSGSKMSPPVIAGPDSVNKGSPVTFTCDVADSQPKAKYEWEVPEGANIPASAYSDNKSKLTLSSVEYVHAGEYTCKAYNDFHEETVSKTLQVKGKCAAELKIIQMAQSTVSDTAAHVVLQCVTSGNPKCTVELISPNEDISGGTHTKTQKGSQVEHDFTYTELQKVPAPVNVTCKASNAEFQPTMSNPVTLQGQFVVQSLDTSSAGLSSGVIVLIIIIVVVIVVGVPVGCYVVNKKRKSKTSKDINTKDADLESTNEDDEREKLNAGSEKSDSLPPPASELHDDRFGQDMTTFATQK